MRFTTKETNTSGKKVYNMTLGASEMVVLQDALNFVYKFIALSFFTAPMRVRLKNMKNALGKVIAEDKLKEKYRRTNGFNESDLEETL